VSVDPSRLPHMDETECVALVALLGESAVTDPARSRADCSAIASQLVRSGSAHALWNERHPLALDGMGESDAALMRARHRLATWRAEGVDLLTVLDQRYPLHLRRIQQVPPVLFVKGDLRSDAPGVSVVGSRAASITGQQKAADIARGLAERGIGVISGLALGIDTAAHEATLAAGGRPIGVLGTGVNQVYPAQSRGLHDRVATAGALVSQFLPDAPPDRHTFRMRSATLSGLAVASVIVEAGERSGSRILARLSVEQSRPLILSDAVVSSTRWGAELSHRSEVYTASTAVEVLDIVDAVVSDVDIGA